MNQLVQVLHHKLLGEGLSSRIRNGVLLFALVGFLVHLLLWSLFHFQILDVDLQSSSLFKSPLSSLYTPFSILLAYEVYELIKAMPESFSVAVGKQFEVVTLLVVRDIFKNLSTIDLAQEIQLSSELGIVVTECFTFLFLFYTALKFHQYGSNTKMPTVQAADIESFVRGKKAIAVVLFIVYVAVALMSFLGWLNSVSQGDGGVSREIFFFDFFTFLILADIFVLLFSYKYSHDFIYLARNTGFVLSTIILRVAISSEGYPALILFLLSAVLGLMILWVTRQFQKNSATAVPLQKPKND